MATLDLRLINYPNYPIKRISVELNPCGICSRKMFLHSLDKNFFLLSLCVKTALYWPKVIIIVAGDGAASAVIVWNSPINHFVFLNDTQVGSHSTIRKVNYI